MLDQTLYPLSLSLTIRGLHPPLSRRKSHLHRSLARFSRALTPHVRYDHPVEVLNHDRFNSFSLERGSVAVEDETGASRGRGRARSKEVWVTAPYSRSGSVTRWHKLTSDLKFLSPPSSLCHHQHLFLPSPPLLCLLPPARSPGLPFLLPSLPSKTHNSELIKNRCL